MLVRDLASFSLIGLSALINSPSMTCAVKINACVLPYLQDSSLIESPVASSHVNQTLSSLSIVMKILCGGTQSPVKMGIGSLKLCPLSVEVE